MYNVIQRDQKAEAGRLDSHKNTIYSGAPNVNIVQNRLNIALLNVF